MKWWLFTIGICQVVLRVSTCPSKSGIPPDEQWVNSLTKKLNFECPSGHSISRIEVQENLYFKQANVLSRTIPTTHSATAEKSNFFPTYDRLPLFLMQSAFDGRDFDDRVWRMTCRFAEDKIINKDCFWTPWLNEYDRPLTYQVID